MASCPPEAGGAAVQDEIARLLQAAQAAEADVVLVQPPFASPDRPALGLHVLHRIGLDHSHRVAVVYANLGFARLIGPWLYRRLCHTATEHLIGERIFRRSWMSAMPFGRGKVPDIWKDLPTDTPDFFAMQDIAEEWCAQMAKALAALPARVIGMSTTFEQTVASLALIERVKAISPDKLTIIGGANADDEMGEGLADLCPSLDHVFQGEAEASFLRFLDDIRAGRTLPRVLNGTVNTDLQALAPPVYDTFFAQWDALLGDTENRAELRLPYESSRGCWWGAKHHCTFCGLNANGMTHRTKSAEKTEHEIVALAERHAIERILMVDNIMPHGYFSTLLPELAKREQKLQVFYEQKANLGRRRMALLKAAGVTEIQPGIESLSTALLQRMRKGTSLAQNLDCLRQARSAGINLAWNLLGDFPGDAPEDYETMIRIIPALHHLQPPGGLGGLSIDRFSPYHIDPEQFGISDVRPLPAYGEAFPMTRDPRLAYHFEGDYSSALRKPGDLRARLEAVLADWEEAWKDPPLFALFDLGTDRFLVVDTRNTADEAPIMVGHDDAVLLLKGAREMSDRVARLLDQQMLIEGDGRYLPIVCATLDSALWDASVDQLLPV